jgi:membrane protein
MSWYLGRGGFDSVFGAAGSLVVLLLWVYYSAQILLFGAEITEVYAKRFGTYGRRARESSL